MSISFKTEFHALLSSTYFLTTFSGLFLLVYHTSFGYSPVPLIVIFPELSCLNCSRIFVVSLLSPLNSLIILSIESNEISLFSLSFQIKSVSRLGINSTPTLNAVSLLRYCANSDIIVCINTSFPSCFMIESEIHKRSLDGLADSSRSALTIIGVITASKAQYAFSNCRRFITEPLMRVEDIYLRPTVLQARLL